MANTTIRQFAESVGIPLDRLMGQLSEAGLEGRDPDAPLSDDDKSHLLDHLRDTHTDRDKGSEDEEGPRQITLKRKSHSQITLPGSGERSRSPRGGSGGKKVNVEVRKKRTYVKRSAVEAENRERDAKILLDVLQRDLEAAEQQAEPQPVQEAANEAEAVAAGSAEAPESHADSGAAEVEEAETQGEVEEPSEAPPEPTVEAEPEPAAEPGETEAQQAESEAQRKKDIEAEKERKRLEAEARREREAEERAARKQEQQGKGKGKGKKQDTRGKQQKGGQRRGRSDAGRQIQQEFEKPTQPVVREVEIPESITVGDLAERMSVKAADLIKEMMKQGVMATINQVIDQDTAVLLVEEMGHKPKVIKEDDIEEEVLQQAEQPEGEQVPRAPVVTIMGHVDHGKTSLLDYVRRTRVAAGETGGITQHIGAYKVQTDHGGMLTFLDTPGHEAFTAMRARGTQVTDVVILVVAADDGVMPQTAEAVKHARAAEVPIVVAVNKTDKPDADPERVKQELAQYEVLPEDWGGDVQFVHVSAITGDGVEGLLEAVSLQAELLELTAVQDCPANGIVIESSLDKGRGPVATILVRNGVLHRGDVLISGTEYGRVRAMHNEAGERVDEAGPSTPVEVLGLSGLPEAGEDAVVVEDERKAREVAEHRREKNRDKRLQAQKAAKMDELFSQMSENDVKTVNLVLKGDVQGSVEALQQSLQNLTNDEVRIKVVSNGVGAITESDVNLAMASEALLIGFNVRADSQARKLARENDVELYYYSVIYDAIDQLKTAISGMLEPETREEIIGTAEVREVFRSSKFGQIAGCLVTEGVVRRQNPIRVLRDNVVVFEGQLESLKRYKDDANEVRSGTECGIGVKNYNDVRTGDQIECYERYEVQRRL
jgi:translation initiation factor IF-2